ncbi:Molybdate/tungstate import ATP-binding protein WtpC [Candidatus Tiddalikarchaeum anstoanum]|nr:Molybdate/tungstate import ATP-binding protein WtpC [Candidatus Tiddalikarchaeum anstoanum]
MPPNDHGPGIAAHGNRVRSGEISDKTLWLWLFNYLKTYKTTFLVLLVLLLAFTVLSAFLPYLQQRVIDEGILKGSITETVNLSTQFLLILFISFFGSSIISYFLGKYGAEIIRDIRLDLFKNIQNMSMEYFEMHNSGDIISTATNDIDQLNMVFGGQLAIMLANLFKAGVILFLMINSNWEMTLLSLLIVPVLTTIVLYLNNLLRAAFRKTRQKVSLVTQVISQNISGMKVIKSYGREKESLEEFDKVNWENREAMFATGKIFSFFFPLVTFIVYVFMSLIILYAGYGLLNNGVTLFGSSISIGELSAFNAYLMQLLFPIIGILMFKQISDSAMASSERIYRILNEKNSISETTNPQNINDVKGDIEFKNVSFNYKSREKNVKKDISLILKQLLPFEANFVNNSIKELNYDKKLLFVQRFIELSDDERLNFIKKVKSLAEKHDVILKFAQNFNTELNYNKLASILDKRLLGQYTPVYLNNEFDINNIDIFVQEKDLSNTQILELLSTQKDVKKYLNSFSNDVRKAIEEYRKINEQKKGDVLKNINLVIPKGKTVAFVGETGAGKSTVAKLIARFYDVNSGEIVLDKTNIKDFKIKDLRSIIGMVPQDNFLFTGTILENIYYGLNKKPEIDEKFLKITKSLGLHDFIKELPEGYNTEIREMGSNLSLGQRQLICFARVLLINPKILILDEATSSIDPYSEKLIQAAIKKISEGRTTIIIAHRLSTIMDADIICVMSNGRIIESGTHEELMKEKGHYFDLINIQKQKQ